MGYLFLAGAIIAELIGATLLKFSEGFSKIAPTIFCIVPYIVCFFFMSRSLSTLKLSVVYATWSGIGIVATTLLSVLLFKEKISGLGVLGIVLAIAGVVLLNVFGTEGAH